MTVQLHAPESLSLAAPAIVGDLRLHAALIRLGHARACARHLGRPDWEYAIDIAELLDVGLQTSDLRWLVDQGYLLHATEVTRPRDASRRFKTWCNLRFNKETCFVLTDTGAALAAAFGEQPPPTPPGGPSSGPRQYPGRERAPGRRPSWDGNRRVLSMDGHVVKQLKVRSPSQEAILAAFEEEGWPAAIDDPIAPDGEQDQRHRLRRTIQSLNGCQQRPLLRFRGDGTGQRIYWELAEEALPMTVKIPRLHPAA